MSCNRKPFSAPRKGPKGPSKGVPKAAPAEALGEMHAVDEVHMGYSVQSVHAHTHTRIYYVIKMNLD